MSKSICVFSGSSQRVAPAFFDAAAELGRLIGARGWEMVFGGGTIGLMGATARGVHEAGGRVSAVIPHRLNRPGVLYETADELITTDTLRERKAVMDARADAFVALPGGFGTLEEAVEAITLKQLRYHERAIVFLNTLNFYDGLIAFFHQQVRDGFVRADHQSLYHVAQDPAEVMDYLDRYVPATLPGKLEQA
jgi:uncharacterized protein (TIGR00730 family)